MKKSRLRKSKAPKNSCNDYEDGQMPKVSETKGLNTISITSLLAWGMPGQLSTFITTLGDQ